MSEEEFDTLKDWIPAPCSTPASPRETPVSPLKATVSDVVVLGQPWRRQILAGVGLMMALLCVALQLPALLDSTPACVPHSRGGMHPRRAMAASAAAAVGFAVGIPSVPGILDNIVIGLLSGVGSYFSPCACAAR